MNDVVLSPLSEEELMSKIDGVLQYSQQIDEAHRPKMAEMINSILEIRTQILSKGYKLNTFFAPAGASSIYSYMIFVTQDQAVAFAIFDTSSYKGTEALTSTIKFIDAIDSQSEYYIPKRVGQGVEKVRVIACIPGNTNVVGTLLRDVQNMGKLSANMQNLTSHVDSLAIIHNISFVESILSLKGPDSFIPRISALNTDGTIEDKESVVNFVLKGLEEISQ